jgi:hypothetical protein
MHLSIDKDPLYRQLLFSLPMREGTGSATVQDTAKPHHPVTQTHAPAWTQLASGQWVLAFNKAHPDYLQVPAASAVDLNFTAGDFSITAWVYITDLSTYATIIIKGDPSVPKDGYRLLVWNNSSLAFHTMQAGVGQYSMTAASTLSINTWVLIGVSRTGSSARLYLNGQDATSTVGVHVNPVSPVTRKLLIGIDNNEVAAPFPGNIGGPRIWGRALSAAEQMEIFKRERDLFGV